MAKKYPKTPPEGDENAYIYLRQFFVSNEWKFFEARELFSGVEYGDDILLRVVENGSVKEAQCIIQSKTFTTPNRTKGKRLKAEIKVSTLNFLAEANLPILLFYLDTVKDIGYWMWLDEWYYKNYMPNWEEKRTISVPINKANNVLDISAVSKIRRHVIQEHKKQLIARKSVFHSKNDPNFNFRFSSLGKGYSIGIEPKDEEALSRNPINIEVSFAGEAVKQLIEMRESGKSAQFEGKYKIQGLPEWLLEEIDSEESTTITLIPLTDAESNLQIEYLDSDQNTLFQVFANFKQKRRGTKYQKWEGMPKTYPIVFHIILDVNKPETKMSFSYSGSKIPKDILWYNDLLNKLSNTKRVKVTNLDTNTPYVLENYTVSISTNALSEEKRELLNDLILINEKYPFNLLLPDNEIKFEEVINIQALAEGIRTGKTYLWSAIPYIEGDDDIVIVVTIKKDEYTSFIENLGGYNFFPAPISPSKIIVDLLGKKFEIEAEQIVYITEIANEDYVLEQITSDKDLIDIPLNFDREASYIYFPQWDEKEEKN